MFLYGLGAKNDFYICKQFEGENKEECAMEMMWLAKPKIFTVWPLTDLETHLIICLELLLLIGICEIICFLEWFNRHSPRLVPILFPSLKKNG